MSDDNRRSFVSFSAKYIVIFAVFFKFSTKEGWINLIEEIVLNLVNQMEAKKIIEENSREFYEYALVTIAERVISVSTMLIIAIIYKQFFPTVAFLIFFLSLRKRTGGYHADKFWQCYLLTVMSYIGVVQVASVLSEKSHIMYALLFLAVLVVEVIGTVNHPNIDLDENELRETKKSARLIVLIETGVIVVFAVLKINQLYVSYMSIAIILCSSLMCLAKMIKQEVRVR